MIKEEDLILCTVTKIVGTTVFVKTEEGEEGTIITSEIAPGRIRNLRDYVVPNKKIVCKVLKKEGKNIHLSLRRVTSREKKEITDQYKKEKTASSILRTVLGEKAQEIENKIKKQESLHDFFQKCKENPKQLEKYLEKDKAAKICKILSEKKEKKKQVKKEFKLSSDQPDGIKTIKKILLDNQNNSDITYLAAGRYSIKMISDNYKQAEKAIDQILEQIGNQAKSALADFAIIEKKK